MINLVNIVQYNMDNQQGDNKKLDTKKIRKYYNFMIFTLCHYALNIYTMKHILGPINYPVLIELLNNCIFNVLTLCLANNINLDKTKLLIDKTCLLVTDYITICREEEFKDKSDKLRLANAIAYGYQKIHDKIVANIPTITKHTNFIDSIDTQCGKVPNSVRHVAGNHLLPDKPSSLPKSFGRQVNQNKWSSIDIPSDDSVETTAVVQPSGAMIRNKFNDLSIPNVPNNKPVLCIRGVNITKTSKIIYLMCALVTRIFSNMIKISFAYANQLNNGFIKFIDCASMDDSKLSANIGIIETYLNCIYPVIYTMIKNNIYMDLAEVENDLGLVVLKSGRDYLVAMYIYLRELCKMHAGIDRFVNHKIISDISLFIKTHENVFEHASSDSIKNKNIICDIKWFDAIYLQFSHD